MRLCFGFVLETILICKDDFSNVEMYFTESNTNTNTESSSATRTIPPAGKLGEHTPGISEPSLPKRYSVPYDVMLSGKSWGKKKQGESVGCILWGEDIQSDGVYHHCYMWWSPVFLEMAEHLPGH